MFGDLVTKNIIIDEEFTKFIIKNIKDNVGSYGDWYFEKTPVKEEILIKNKKHVTYFTGFMDLYDWSVPMKENKTCEIDLINKIMEFKYYKDKRCYKVSLYYK